MLICFVVVVGWFFVFFYVCVFLFFEGLVFFACFVLPLTEHEQFWCTVCSTVFSCRRVSFGAVAAVAWADGTQMYLT